MGAGGGGAATGKALTAGLIGLLGVILETDFAVCLTRAGLTGVRATTLLRLVFATPARLMAYLSASTRGRFRGKLHFCQRFQELFQTVERIAHPRFHARLQMAVARLL